MIAKPNLKLYSKYMQQGVSSVKLVLVILLLIGLGVGIYLATRPQVYRSKAGTIGSDWVNALEMTDQSGNRIVCNTATNPPECVTNTSIIKVKVINPNLLNQLPHL